MSKHHLEIEYDEYNLPDPEELAVRMTYQPGAPMNEYEERNWEEHFSRFGCNVDHPSHYTAGKIECIEAIEEALSADELRGYYKGNALKYIWRERMKGGSEDIKKARWYLDRLVEVLCDEK